MDISSGNDLNHPTQSKVLQGIFETFNIFIDMHVLSNT